MTSALLAPDHHQYQHYVNPDLSIRVYHRFLHAGWCTALLEYLVKEVPWPHSHHNQSGVLSKRRNKKIYGEIPSYSATFQGKTLTTTVYPWEQMPVLRDIRDLIATATGQPYNVCVLQLYNNGAVGIKPHFDKEMKSGTIIASISLGETRTMTFTRTARCHPDSPSTLSLPLVSGSLCTLDPPTNDRYLHSIDTDATQGRRMSMVFRYYT